MAVFDTANVVSPRLIPAALAKLICSDLEEEKRGTWLTENSSLQHINAPLHCVYKSTEWEDKVLSDDLLDLLHAALRCSAVQDLQGAGVLFRQEVVQGTQVLSYLNEGATVSTAQPITEKTKEIIVDFRRNADSHPPLHIKGTAVERVNGFKFLGVHISEDLTWTTSCSKLVKKAHQRLFFLRTLRRNQLSSDILVNFYRCTIESILTNCITAWYGCCSATDRKALQRVVKAAQRITGTPLPAIEDIYRKRCLKRAGKIIKESSHPAHTLFTLLPSGRRYRSLRTRTTSFTEIFELSLPRCQLVELIAFTEGHPFGTGANKVP
ncbi:hypothetical protein NFI96_005874 [Prochilodus magdalenae]|nr:hypothetical protein NFI96_005874 [Prochilodus magdalenae]